MSPTDSADAEVVAQELTKILGARYGVFETTAKFPPGGMAQWMVQSADFDPTGKTLHVDAVWKEESILIVESRGVGSIGEWTSWDYGESAVGKLRKMDFTSIGNPEVKEALFRQFPKLKARIEVCESTLERLSAVHQVPLRIRYDGRKGGAILYLQALLKAGDLPSEIAQIRVAEAALRASVEEIGRLQARTASK